MKKEKERKKKGDAALFTQRGSEKETDPPFFSPFFSE
jgi:hypothetical protein